MIAAGQDNAQRHMDMIALGRPVRADLSLAFTFGESVVGLG